MVLEEPLFQFAVISDTHIRPSKESSSPWKTNLMTNDRAGWVVKKIASFDPSLVVHLGDIVHPVPHLPTYSQANQVANSLMSRLTTSVYYVPGNHDIGDKDNPMVPAYIVNDEYIQSFKKYYGPTYQSFDHGDIHFILINSPVFNSGLEEERKQHEWLEEDLKASSGKRIFVFSHYPPYIYRSDEQDNYDNIDQPGRGWLLELLSRYNVEAFFAGHVHQFGYKRYKKTRIYNLLSTCFVRQDYSEMFRVQPAEEYGRDDTPKLGYCIVEVYPEGHKVEIYRSYGRTLQDDTETIVCEQLNPLKTNVRPFSPLGVHLRHPLIEAIDLPYMGPLDEFVRKRMVNDYPILGLWETGIGHLRLPLEDLWETENRKRIKDLHDDGYRFVFFAVNTQDTDLIKPNLEVIDALEVIVPWEKVKTMIHSVSELRESTGIPVYLANIESSIHREQKGPKFSHYISHGFHIDHVKPLEEILPRKECIDGFVFQVEQHEDPLNIIGRISRYADENGFKALANVRLSSEDPAEYLADDDYVAEKAVEAALAAYMYPNVTTFLDTFIDHDRGYFPRVGLYDRRVNPRKSANILRNLSLAIQGSGEKIVEIDVQNKTDAILFELEKAYYRLFPLIGGIDPSPCTTVIDLVTGEINPKNDGEWRLEIVKKM